MRAEMIPSNQQMGRFGHGSTPSPFYTIANQFVPRNFHDVIRVARFVLTQSPTVAEVIRKYATYPITEYNISTENPATRKKYQEIIKSIQLKQVSSDCGVNLMSIGNSFASLYFPITRMLVCPSCNGQVSCDVALRTLGINYRNFNFEGACPSCSAKTTRFTVKDAKSTNIKDIRLIQWTPEHISVNHNPISGVSEYWYTIPGDFKRRVMMGDPLVISSTPLEILDAIKNKQDFLFETGSIYHVKGLNMTGVLEGLGMPPIISLYSSIFHQMTLKKANEAIASDHLTPLRIVHPAQASAAGDPIAMMSMRGFVANMEDAFKKHKNDPNHVLIAPIPIGYQPIGGQGRALLLTQELAHDEESILLGLGVSKELLSGTTNWTSSTVGLRLLENAMRNISSEAEGLANWALSKIAAYLGIEQVEVTLQPFSLTDDPALKHALPQFLEAGLVSPSTTLSAFNIDFSREVAKIKKDSVTMAVAAHDKKEAITAATFMKAQERSDADKDDYGLIEIRKQAYAQAAQVIGEPDPTMRAQMLFTLKATDAVLFEQVQQAMDEYYFLLSKQLAGPAAGVDHPDDDSGVVDDTYAINKTDGAGRAKGDPGLNPKAVQTQFSPEQ
jgi:hypothetical protein